MDYWRSKVLPKIKKVFDKNGNKRAATEACKSFDDSKVEIDKEFEEKKTELQPKVIEVYEASSTEIKTLMKELTDAGVKKNSIAVQKFLEELVKIEFPGSKQVSEASSKFGLVLVSDPVLFVLEKVSTFIVTEEKPAETTREITTTETATETATETESTIKTEETSGKDKEIAIEEKKEVKATEPEDPVEETRTKKTETTESAAPASSEAPKVQEAQPPKA